MNRAAEAYHVEILVLVQVVHLEQILRFQTERFASFQEHFNVLPLRNIQQKKQNQTINIKWWSAKFHPQQAAH